MYGLRKSRIGKNFLSGREQNHLHPVSRPKIDKLILQTDKIGVNIIDRESQLHNCESLF